MCSLSFSCANTHPKFCLGITYAADFFSPPKVCLSITYAALFLPSKLRLGITYAATSFLPSKNSSLYRMQRDPCASAHFTFFWRAVFIRCGLVWKGRKEGRKFACEQYTCVVFGTRGRRAVRKASHRMDVYVTVIPHDGVGEFHAFISSRMSFSRTNLRLQFISLPLC